MDANFFDQYDNNNFFNQFDGGDGNFFDQFEAQPERYSIPEAIGEGTVRALGGIGQIASDLVGGTAGFLGGLPYWFIEMLREGDVGKANKAFEATSGYIGEGWHNNVPRVPNETAQSIAGEATGAIGKTSDAAGKGVSTLIQRVDPSIAPEKADEYGKAAVILGSFFGPYGLRAGKAGFGALKEKVWEPRLPSPTQSPAPVPSVPVVPTVSGAPAGEWARMQSAAKQLSELPDVLLKRRTIGRTKVNPRPRRDTKVTLDASGYPGAIDRFDLAYGKVFPPAPPPLPPIPPSSGLGISNAASTGAGGNYFMQESTPSNIIDNLYVKALKTVGGDEKHPLFTGLRKMEADIILKKSEFDPIRDAWIDAYRSLSKKERKVAEDALFSKDLDTARNVFNTKAPGLGDALLRDLKAATDKRFAEMKEVFPSIIYRDKYFPRWIKDVKGWKNAMKRSQSTATQRKIEGLQKEFDAGRISELEFQTGLNKLVLNKVTPEVNKPTSGHAKPRMLDEVPPELRQYYEHPIRALNEYFNETGQTVVERRFLGRGKPEEAITARMTEAQDQGLLTPAQATNFEKILKIRFSPQAKRSAGPWTRTAKDVGYMATIGNHLSTAIQVLDVIPAAAKYGVMNTLNAAIKSALPRVVRKKLKVMEPSAVGLMDIAHDITVTAGSLGRGSKGAQKMADVANYTLNNLLDLVSFKMGDRFGKRTIMTAALNKFASMSKGKRGDAYLTQRGFRNIYKTPAEWSAFKDALASKNIGDIRVREAMVMELFDLQPLSISSMPVTYIMHPQGRIFYMLKTWAVRQLNAIRESNLKGRKGEALKLTGALVLSNMAAPMLRDLIRSMWGNEKIKENDISDYAIAALLRLVFADKYAQQIGDVEGAGDVMGVLAKAVRDIPGTVFPPQVNMVSMLLSDIKDYLNEGESEWKSRRYLPGVGPYAKDKQELQQ